MSHITITPAPGTWEARVGNKVIARSSAVLELREGGYPPVLYFPRADADASLLDKTRRTSTCPHKGAASYYSVADGDRQLENAIWSYEAPKADVSAIAGHLAFYTDKVALVQV